MSATFEIDPRTIRPLMAYLARRKGLRHAARGDHVGALRASRDVEVLSRLGLHLSVLRAPIGRRASEQFARALAKAELGSPSDAIALVREQSRIRARDRSQLLLAAARWEPLRAYELSAGLVPGVRAALAWHAGLAGAVHDFWRAWPAVSRSDRSDPGDTFLRAAFAAHHGDHQAARAHANTAFRAYGLAPPLDNTPLPITLDAFRSDTASLDLARSDVAAPRVSVIMPVRSMAGSVEIAVRSVLAQRGVTVDVIVVDDGSTDATPMLVGKMAKADPRVRLHCCIASGGTYAARNIGLGLATAPFIAFNDADDWSHPDRLSRQLAPLSADQTLLATESRLVRLDLAGRFVSPRIYPLVRANRSSLVFRRSILDRVGTFEPVMFGADEEFTARLSACFGAERIRRLPIPLAVGLQSASSLTGAVATGIGTPSAMHDRIAYREMWMARHVQLFQQAVQTADVAPTDRQVWP